MNGALSAILCVGFGAYALVQGTDGASPTTHLGFLALSPALGAVGGYVRRRTKPSLRSDDAASAAAA